MTEKPTPADGDVSSPSDPVIDSVSTEAENGEATDDSDSAAPEASESPATAEPETKSDGAQTPHPRRRVRNPAIARAFRSGRPVQGKVEKAIKGGYEVRIGRARAFCPFSQMEIHRVESPEEHEGKQYLFRVIQFRRGGDDIVLSRRVLLEEERSEEAKAVYATLLEGAIMQGHVASIADFGAFVDLGAGVLGLVHISELSHVRVERVSEAVKLGDPVTVKILKIDGVKHRISLSIRQAQADPWLEVARAFEVGKVYPGNVSRLTDFGVFVRMADGVEALAPARDLPPTEGEWHKGFEPDQDRRWLVLAVEPDRHRLTVIPEPEEGSSSPADVKEGATLVGRVKKVERFGVLVWLAPGRVGLVPAPWTGVPRGTPLGKRFPAGHAVEVEVVELDNAGRRIRLGIKGVPREPLEPRRERTPSKRAGHDTRDVETASDTATFGTSLGDALRDAFTKRDQD